jgi:hypothetical protein
MRPHLFLLLLACTLSCSESPRYVVGEIEHGKSRRISNLNKAAALPWTDNGHCVVQEASNDWPVVVERCFAALDSRRIRFQDPERRCAVATADAVTLESLVGICVLSQPEVVVGAVVILGVVVVAAEISAALEEEDPCKKVAESCRETCSKTSLPSGNYGFKFWNCINACMEEHGCPPSTK